jgi:glycerol uptake facilitator protein
LSIIGAETIGTALLILLGDGVVAAVLLASSKAQNSGWIVITWGWGMGVMFAVLAVGQFSGAHLNPAVTLGFAVIGNTEWSDVPKYLIGEFAGAMLGACLVAAAYSNHWRATFAFGGFFVGLLVLAIGLSLGGPTGYAINPARDLGPRIVHAILPIPGKGDSDWGYAWIPVVAPIIGGILGALAFDAFYPG